MTFGTPAESRDKLSYTVKISPRARRCFVRISPVGQVEVILAKGVQAKYAQTLLSKHRDWIEKNLRRLAELRPDQYLTSHLPDRIVLHSINEEWKIDNVENNVRTALFEKANSRQIQIHYRNDDHVKLVLNKWLNRKANNVIPLWFLQVSKEIGLNASSISIRRQTSRWGSCSSSKRISVNRNLIFLPPSLVRYLFIHELCHTVHLNHSSRFWQLVESFESNYQQLDRELNSANRYVPLWAFSR